MPRKQPLTRKSTPAPFSAVASLEAKPALTFTRGNGSMTRLFRMAKDDEPCPKCASKLHRKAAPARGPQGVPPIVYQVLSEPGGSLDPSSLASMEPGFGNQTGGGCAAPARPPPSQGITAVSRPGDTSEREADRLARAALQSKDTSGFTYDLSAVRVHTDQKAAASAQAVGAIAYTVGNEVVFDSGRYAPGTEAGRQLLAHELAHVVLQNEGTDRSDSPRVWRTAATCPADWQTTVQADHDHAMAMLSVARTKLSAYDGTSPAEVNTALATHFHATSAAFAGWVNFNLGLLKLLAHLASYDCEDGGSWWCDPGTLAKSFWCVPGIDIRVCQPIYFAQSPDERSTTLIHEWVHKYGCNFDLGYRGEEGYSSSWTITALLNADPFAQVVKDVQ
jgi:hypothetical protein